MRIMGFSQRWPKLAQANFTTYRYLRRDRDWEAGEIVQVILNPRSSKREKLGIARITGKEYRELDDWFRLHYPDSVNGKVPVITDEEVRADGFADRAEMVAYMMKLHGRLDYISLFHKLTLEWVER